MFIIHQMMNMDCKDIAPALLGNPPVFDLAENLTQCREYHREQLFNWPKFGRRGDLLFICIAIVPYYILHYCTRYMYILQISTTLYAYLDVLETLVIMTIN
jgi:hypothetical protein